MRVAVHLIVAAYSASACCRWAADPTCSPVVDKCSELHEYLEHKTTTHHFVDVEACLGSDPANWAWQFDPASSSTTLSRDSAAVTKVPTPLKVTQAAEHNGVHLQRQSRGRAGAVGSVRDPERRRHRRHRRRVP